MNAELYGSSHPSGAENTTPVSLDEASSPRAELETSVLDALRPLLRPKKRKSSSEAEPQEEGDAILGLAPSSSDTSKTDEDQLFVPSRPDEFSSSKELADLSGFETFMAVGEDLERRGRQSATMARLLDQHRQQLVTAEKERDAAYEQLARVVPVVQETANDLREAMNARKVDEDQARMHRLFMLNGRALDELEKVATALFADFLWVKSAWEQYARSVEDARLLRSSHDS